MDIGFKSLLLENSLEYKEVTTVDRNKANLSSPLFSADLVPFSLKVYREKNLPWYCLCFYYFQDQLSSSVKKFGVFFFFYDQQDW